MSNEEQMADTIEMLYERLNEYNKQDLFNYGYLLESNQILIKDIEEKDKEIERLNNIIDELEKDINSQLTMTRKLDKYNNGFFDAVLHFYNKLKELKEGK